MKIIIQCCASKHENYWYYKGHKIIFVANPDMCENKDSVEYCRTGQRTELNGLTWQEKLEQYNKQEGNDDILKKAGELYKPNIYLELVTRFGPENVFILSAGWGLVRADFYLPAYDITFSYQQASDKFKQRKYIKEDGKFAKFNHLECSGDELIYFFGGIGYLNMYYDLTRNLSCPKVIYYKSDKLDSETNRVKGYRYIKFITTKRQNWHYLCAKDFINGLNEQ